MTAAHAWREHIAMSAVRGGSMGTGTSGDGDYRAQTGMLRIFGRVRRWAEDHKREMQMYAVGRSAVP